MPYIGRPIDAGDFTPITLTESFDGNRTQFTMSESVGTVNQLIVILSGVVQHWTDAFTVSGTTLTFASAPASGVAIQVRHIGFAGGAAGSNAVDTVFGRIGDVVLTNSDDITVRNITAGLVTATTFTGGFAGNITGAAATFTGNVTIGGVLTYQDVTNIDALGIGTFREGIFLPDTKKIELGNSAGSGDLQIFHDGNNSIIKDNGTGAIRILGGNTAFMNAAENKTSATFNTATSVDLRYNNSLKFQTTNTGAIVTGILTATHFSGSSEVGIQSGGVQIGAGITQLNFIGTGNTFAVSGTTVDISISGGSAGAGGTWGSNAVGVHTDKIVGINTSTIAGSATSEGALQVTGNIGITEGLLTLDSNLYTSVSVPSGKNALLIGPTTVAVGATIDVAQGSTLVVV